MLARARICALLTCFAMGCSTPETQLVVTVESDWSVPGELDRVHVRTTRDGNMVSNHTFWLSAPGDVPFSFGLAPRGGELSQELVIVAEGATTAGVVSSHVVRTGFVRGETRLVRLRLDRCAEPPCRRDDTIPPGELPEVTPGEELLDAGAERDAGTADAGTADAGTADAGTADAGTADAAVRDASAPDAAITDGGERVPVSCAEHLADGATADGVYTIDPDGPGGEAPFPVFCEMQDDGGGWTLLLKVDGALAPAGAPSPSQLDYDAPGWTGASTLRPTSLSRAREEAVHEAHRALPIRQLRVELWSSATSSRATVVHGLPGEPLASVLARGEHVALGDVSAWSAVVGESIGASACTQAGLNVRMGALVRVRIGALASERPSCDVAFGWLGVGARAGMQMGCDEGRHTAGGERLCGPPGQRREWERFAMVFGR